MAGKNAIKQKKANITRPCRFCGEEVTVYFGRLVEHEKVCPARPTFETEGELPPGTIMDRGTGAPRKKRWTASDMLKAYPKEGWKKFVPSRSCPVTVNGLRIYLQEGVEISCPSIFYDVYMESVRSDRDISSPRQPSDVYRRSVPYERDSGLLVVGQGLPRPE